MASNTKSNGNQAQNDSKPQLKLNNNSNRSKGQSNTQKQSKPLTPASSLPSKPAFTKKPTGWAAIVGSKSQDPATPKNSPAPASRSSTPGATTLKRSKKPSSAQVADQSNAGGVYQRAEKKSAPPTTQQSKPSHTPLNNFNSSEIREYLTNRNTELHTAYPIETYKNTGSEWSKLSNKFGRKNDKDVVGAELSRHLSKNSKN